MFDIGFTEIILIGVVSLVVIGPERLPDVARTAGKWIGKMQRFVRGVKTDIANELDSGELKKLIGEQREQIDELRKVVGSTHRELESSTRDIVRGARKKLTELEDAAARADGEADADADLVRPDGPSTPPLPSAPRAPSASDGSVAAAARTIGGGARAGAAAGASTADTDPSAAPHDTTAPERDVASAPDAASAGTPEGHTRVEPSPTLEDAPRKSGSGT